MKAIPIILLLAAGIAAPAYSPAAAEGPIGTMARGSYICELPDDVAVKPGVRVPERDFTIGGASRYKSAEGGGIYLRRGDLLMLTSGPRKGESYLVVTEGFLRLIENGEPSRLRCIRVSG